MGSQSLQAGGRTPLPRRVISEAETRVRVVAKIRPRIPSDKPCEGFHARMEIQRDDDSVKLNFPNPWPGKCFSLDSVYEETDGSQTVFDNEIQRRLPSLIDGYSLTVLVYGASGSGKTYLMQGEGDEVPGLVPLCAAWIAASQLEREGYKVSFSYFELYGNKVLDLLRSQDLQILEDAEKNFQIPGLHEEPFASLEAFLEAFGGAKERRHLAETGMNAVSSRSHAILQFNVWLEDNPGIVGRLKLVDLAGRESNKETGNAGVRMTESCDINLSLSALSRVIEELNDPAAKHISYRGSNLTKILQDSLGGSSRGVMIACLAPNDNALAKEVLKVAAQSREIHNNVAKTKLPAPPKQTGADRLAELAAYKAKKAQSKAIVPSHAAGPSAYSGSGPFGGRRSYIPYPARVPREEKLRGELHRIQGSTQFKRSPTGKVSAPGVASSPTLIPRPRGSLSTLRPGSFVRAAAEALDNAASAAEGGPVEASPALAVAEAASAAANAVHAKRRTSVADRMTASIAAKMVSSDARRTLAHRRSMVKHHSPKKIVNQRQGRPSQRGASLVPQPKASGQGLQRQESSSGMLQRQDSSAAVVAAVSVAAASVSVAAAAATAEGSPLAPNLQHVHNMLMASVRQPKGGDDGEGEEVEERALPMGDGVEEGESVGDCASECAVEGEETGESQMGPMDAGAGYPLATPANESEGEAVECMGEGCGVGTTGQPNDDELVRRVLLESYRDPAAAAAAVSDTFEISACCASSAGSSSGSADEESTADQGAAESKVQAESAGVEFEVRQRESAGDDGTGEGDEEGETGPAEEAGVVEVEEEDEKVEQADAREEGDGRADEHHIAGAHVAGACVAAVHDEGSCEGRGEDASPLGWWLVQGGVQEDLEGAACVEGAAEQKEDGEEFVGEGEVLGGAEALDGEESVGEEEMVSGEEFVSEAAMGNGDEAVGGAEALSETELVAEEVLSEEEVLGAAEALGGEEFVGQEEMVSGEEAVCEGKVAVIEEIGEEYMGELAGRFEGTAAAETEGDGAAGDAVLDEYTAHGEAATSPRVEPHTAEGSSFENPLGAVDSEDPWALVEVDGDFSLALVPRQSIADTSPAALNEEGQQQREGGQQQEEWEQEQGEEDEMEMGEGAEEQSFRSPGHGAVPRQPLTVLPEQTPPRQPLGVVSANPQSQQPARRDAMVSCEAPDSCLASAMKSLSIVDPSTPACAKDFGNQFLAVAEAELIQKFNTATKEELMQMKGIGPAYATKICAFREAPSAGATPFRAFTDLYKAGINLKKVDRIRQSNIQKILHF